jgi:hypothetical protein
MIKRSNVSVTAWVAACRGNAASVRHARLGWPGTAAWAGHDVRVAGKSSRATRLNVVSRGVLLRLRDASRHVATARRTAVGVG